MAIDLKLFPATWRGNFPHMSSGDRPLWLRYLDTHPKDWDTYAYDVAVGGQNPPLDITDPAIRYAWRFNTAKRIDALGFRRDAIAIFEVRVSAGVGAIGSLATYEHLLREDMPDVRPVLKVLITDLIAPDTQRAAEALGIRVLTFPP